MKEWIEEARNDTKINFQNLENSLNIAFKIAKWLERRQELQKAYSELYKQKLKIKRQLMIHYKNEFEFIPRTNEELKALIESDDKYQEIDQKQLELEQKIDFINRVIDALKIKTYEIKYWLEYKKLIEGV